MTIESSNETTVEEAIHLSVSHIQRHPQLRGALVVVIPEKNNQNFHCKRVVGLYRELMSQCASSKGAISVYHGTDDTPGFVTTNHTKAQYALLLEKELVVLGNTRLLFWEEMYCREFSPSRRMPAVSQEVARVNMSKDLLDQASRFTRFKITELKDQAHTQTNRFTFNAKLGEHTDDLLLALLMSIIAIRAEMSRPLHFKILLEHYHIQWDGGMMSMTGE